jgi:hypothetical protein
MAGSILLFSERQDRYWIWCLKNKTRLLTGWKPSLGFFVDIAGRQSQDETRVIWGILGVKESHPCLEY